ncbi:hypothetical protein GGX14DRAFT_572217 [Mycena pura]|uniref:Uncharacterized protein n=1 Tax=Mycena pura TaxID=153505 RepID=A0AAD6Y740_9AGAR|nr:hypothetical protein GGX14DRAFT_572217 [Mycena pura]
MPPTTTHALPHGERLRLMRSTRKLAAMLGETPLLLDAPAAPARQAHARSLSTLDPAGRPPMAPAATASLWRSASTLSAHSPHGAPRPLLVIALPTALAAASAADSVAASSFEAPPSPSTPASAMPRAGDADAARRRKLAKLSRTLGAHVPPALVFPATTTTTPTTGRRRASTLSVPGRTSSDSAASRESQQRLLQADTDEAAMHRRERGWSGEWAGSVHSMDDVVRGLRQMRVQYHSCALPLPSLWSARCAPRTAPRYSSCRPTAQHPLIVRSDAAPLIQSTLAYSLPSTVVYPVYR